MGEPEDIIIFPPLALPLVNRAAFPAVKFTSPPTAAPAVTLPAIALDEDMVNGVPAVVVAATVGGCAVNVTVPAAAAFVRFKPNNALPVAVKLNSGLPLVSSIEVPILG